MTATAAAAFVVGSYPHVPVRSGYYGGTEDGLTHWLGSPATTCSSSRINTRSLGIVWVALASACGDVGLHEVDTSIETSGTDLSDDVLETPWQPVARVVVADNGTTEDLSPLFDALAPSTPVRIRPAEVNNGTVYCYSPIDSARDTGERGALLLLERERAAHPVLQIAVRDCATSVVARRESYPDRPTELVVESWPNTDGACYRRIELVVGRTRSTGYGESALADNPHWIRALGVAQDVLSSLAVQLQVRETLDLQVDGELVYTPDDTLALDAAHIQMAANSDLHGAVPVVLAGCLRFRDPIFGTRNAPDGFSTHLPGWSQPASHPSLIGLATSNCVSEPNTDDLMDASALGLVLAHEIGHHLGLHHPDDPAHRAEGLPGERNIMTTAAASLDPEEAAFSGDQRAVTCGHPLRRGMAERR